MCEAVVQMFTRLSNAPNRRILYDLYDYICDIKSGVGLARAHIKTLGKRGNRGNRGQEGARGASEWAWPAPTSRR